MLTAIIEQIAQDRPLEINVSDMGSFRITIAIEHPARRGTLRSIDHVLVDTGSEFTWVPTAVLKELGVAREGVQRFVVADGRVIERAIGIAIVHR